MSTIEWSESFMIGVHQIDQHNRHLVELMKKTHEVLLADPPSSNAKMVLNELINYIFYHFGSEEIWMEKSRFPGLHLHQEEHLRYTRTIVDLLKEFNSGNLTALETLGSIFHLFIRHIWHADTKYANFIAGAA